MNELQRTDLEFAKMTETMLRQKAMCEDMADQLERICETLVSLPKRTDQVWQTNMLVQDAIKELRRD